MEQLSPMSSVLFLFFFYSAILVAIFRPKFFFVALLLVLNALFLIGLCCFGEEVRVLSAGLVGCEVGVFLSLILDRMKRKMEGRKVRLYSDFKKELTTLNVEQMKDCKAAEQEVRELVERHAERMKAARKEVREARLQSLFEQVKFSKDEDELNSILEEIYRLKK